MGVRVKLSSNRTTILVGRASLVHVSMKQRVEGQARVKLKYFYTVQTSYRSQMISITFSTILQTAVQYNEQ